MMKKSRALLRLLVLCLCVGVRSAVEETRPSTGDALQGSKLSSPITGHNWKYPRDEQTPYEPRLMQMQHGHADGSSLRDVDESKYRRPFDSKYLNLEEEEAPGSTAASAAAAAAVTYLQGNDLRNPLNNNNIDDDDDVDDVDDPELGQLNLHEAQLARLHGLGPAEIEALYNWQQRMRIPPIFNRNPHHSDSNVAMKRSRAAAGAQDLAGIKRAPLNSADTPTLNDPANLKEEAEPLLNYTSETPATWPKRSASEMKKPEKDGKARNGGYGRKEKTDGANNKAAKGGKNPRRQQSQESVPHLDNPANKGKDGAGGAHERVRGQGAAAPDVSRINRNLATQFLLRSPRENRQYDVPIIGKPLNSFVRTCSLCAVCLVRKMKSVKRSQ